MATDTLDSRSRDRTDEIPVRNITSEDLKLSLRQGLDDFLEMRGDLIFVGLLYPLIGILAAVFTTQGALPFFLPIVAGVGLLGPVAAVGFYELARRREAGLVSNWSHFLDVRKRPAIDDMGIVAGLLLGDFRSLAARRRRAICRILRLGSLRLDRAQHDRRFPARCLHDPPGWGLIVTGLVVGAIFGWIVLAISVASLPMLVDCDVSASQAVSASWRAAHANKPQMIRWGLTVVGLLVLGSIPLFIGLAFVLPWLGYSTWHLYTRLIDRDAITAQAHRLTSDRLRVESDGHPVPLAVERHRAVPEIGGEQHQPAHFRDFYPARFEVETQLTVAGRRTSATPAGRPPAVLIPPRAAVRRRAPSSTSPAGGYG